MSKTLATAVRDVDVEVDLDHGLRAEPDQARPAGGFQRVRLCDRCAGWRRMGEARNAPRRVSQGSRSFPAQMAPREPRPAHRR